MPGSCDPFRQNHKRIAADALLGIYGDVDENNLFLSIGKIQSWTDDTNPPRSVDSVKDDTDFWKSAFAHKRIDSADVSTRSVFYPNYPTFRYQPISSYLTGCAVPPSDGGRD
jgi:hypothetical protein